MSEAMNAATDYRVNQYKKYPEYRDSGVEWIGEIPQHWTVKRNKRIFIVVNGSTPKSGEADYWDGDITWVTPDDLGGLASPEISQTQRYITIAGYQSCGTTLVPKNSLVLSTRAPIGHLAIAGIDLCANQGCRCLVFRNDSSNKFYYYQLRAANSELQSWGQGSTFRELSKSKLEYIFLTEPSYQEQNDIVSFLDRETEKIDVLIEKNEHLIGLLREKRSALITHAVTKGLDPTVPIKDSGVEWIGEIPEHWNLRKLKYMAKVKQSNINKKKEEGEIPVRLCNYVDVYNNDYIIPNLDFMEATALPAEISKFILKNGDVIITKDSESWDDIAIPAYVTMDFEDVICGYHLAQVRSDTLFIYSKYLFFSFCARGINDQFRVAANGITRFGLGKYWVDNALFPVPPIDEQRSIAIYLKRETAKIDALIKKIIEGIEKLKEYRTALISAAVTGKIDVREEVHRE